MISTEQEDWEILVSLRLVRDWAEILSEADVKPSVFPFEWYIDLLEDIE